MEGQIDQPAAAVDAIQQPVEQPGELRPDAGQAGDMREIRIEQGGAHDESIKGGRAAKVNSLLTNAARHA